MSRRELLEAHRVFYTNAIAHKWAAIFHTETGAMWDKLIPAQATSSTSFAHALTEWGVRLLGVETSAVQPMFAMRTAFTRGAARQHGGNFLYYHAANFGDTATAFTRAQNFAGPDNFFHTRYGATMGPSLSWYRKSYYFYYIAGASGIYLVQSSKAKVQSRRSEAATRKPDKNSKINELAYEGSNIKDEPSRLPSSLSARPSPVYPLDPYRAIVVGGEVELSPKWIQRLSAYVRSGGALVINSAQIKGVPIELLGVRLTGETGEAHNARCLSPGEMEQNLKGQIFRYDKVELEGALPLITSTNGEPFVTVNKVGKGSVVFVAVPDLLGEDERITPFAAHLLAHIFADATPIKVGGDVEYLVNRNENGWVVTLLNNNGVFKPQQGMAQVDRSANVTATISLAGQTVQKAWDWINEKEVEVRNQSGRNSVTVEIAPGGISIIELRLKK